MENSDRGSERGKIYKAVLFEWITILTAVITCFGVLYSEIKSLDGKIERQGERIDKNSEMQIARTDKLYEMFIDLLKETKCPKT